MGEHHLRFDEPSGGQAIAQALALGFRGAFLCEHYGSDAITVISKNRAYLRDILATLID